MSEPQVLLTRTQRVSADPTPLVFELAWPHEELDPGAWRYHVTAEVDGQTLASDTASYTLRHFQFGV